MFIRILLLNILIASVVVIGAPSVSIFVLIMLVMVGLFVGSVWFADLIAILIDGVVLGGVRWSGAVRID